jgi:23S rRNA pseudouridine2605 synthase
VRLVKYLAHCGVASRRASEELIAAGRVSVGGAVITDPARDVSEESDVEVDGKPIALEASEVWAVNKPAGVVSTAREPGRRRAVVELVPSRGRLYPVGRLDADSTGLILLTNDGALANRLTHPRFGVPRTYRARLRHRVTDAQLRALRRGVKLDDGPTGPAGVRQTSPRVVELTIREGRKRQVRRMLETVGNQVLDLKRIRVGSLRLGRLPEGAARRLSRSEVDRLWKDARNG